MIKKLLSSFLLIILSFLGYAQLGKGSIILGGGVGYSSFNVKSSAPSEAAESDHFNISVGAGKAIKDNLFVGMELSTAFSETEYENNTNQNYSEFGGGVFLRRYFNVAKRFYMFAHGNSGVYFNKQEQEYSAYNSENKGYIITLAFSPGISYALNRKLHLEAGFSNLFGASYQHSKYRSGVNESVHNRFGISTNFSSLTNLEVGVRFLFADRLAVQ